MVMKTEFCKFLGKLDKNGNIKIKPLGVAKNNVKNPMLPNWKNVVSEIVINRNYSKGLDGIEDYSHIIVVYWMDKEKECHLKHHPQGRNDVPYIGIFACRCPQRPVPIAMSTVKMLSRRGNVLKVKGLDIVNGTPILDLKPYHPQYDLAKNVKVPSWINRLVF